MVTDDNENTRVCKNEHANGRERAFFNLSFVFFPGHTRKIRVFTDRKAITMYLTEI